MSSNKVTLYFLKEQLGSTFLRSDLLNLPDLDIKEIKSLKEMKDTPCIAIGSTFSQDKDQLRQVNYQCLGLENEMPLETRDFQKDTLLHIDLRIINPLTASAIEPHSNEAKSYRRWEELYLELQKTQNLTQIIISGYCPDRDRTIGLRHKLEKKLQFHLNSSQETHQFTLGLVYNAIEVLRGV